MKNIVLVGISPLVKRRQEVFYIEELIARGYHFTHCDLSPIFFNRLHYDNVLDEKYALTFYSVSTFEDYLKQINIDNTIFIFEVLHSTKFKAVFHLMRKYGCECVKINPNASDFSYYKISFFKEIECYGLFRAFINYIVSLGRSCKDYILGFYFNIYSSYISSGNDSKIDIHINQQDWERAREIGSLKSLVTYKYAVFCDQFFPEHPDFEYLGGINRIDEIKIKYRNELNSFFDYLEKKYSVRIVIAAHPKSNYKGDEFGGRDIIRGKTMELVKNAEFSVVHGSMSISYSVLFNVPIILAMTDEMLAMDYFKRQSFLYSDYFGLTVYNISHNFNVCPEKVTDSVKIKYIYDFLTSPGIEDMHNADILASAFAKM